VSALASNTKGTLYNGALYASYDNGLTFVRGVATYLGGDVATSRGLKIGGASAGTAQGKTHVDGYSIRLAGGHRFELSPRTWLTLEASGARTHVSRDGYTEAAAGGLGLTATALNRDIFTGTGEARLSHRYDWGRTQVVPYVSLGVHWNSGDLDTVSPLRFSGAPAGSGGFIVEGARVSPLLGVAQLGLEVRASDRLSIGIDGRVAAGQNTREGQVGLHLRLGF
jgi:outer membrane autotransporter protein